MSDPPSHIWCEFENSNLPKQPAGYLGPCLDPITRPTVVKERFHCRSKGLRFPNRPTDLWRDRNWLPPFEGFYMEAIDGKSFQYLDDPDLVARAHAENLKSRPFVFSAVTGFFRSDVATRAFGIKFCSIPVTKARSPDDHVPPPPSGELVACVIGQLPEMEMHPCFARGSFAWRGSLEDELRRFPMCAKLLVSVSGHSWKVDVPKRCLRDLLGALLPLARQCPPPANLGDIVQMHSKIVPRIHMIGQGKYEAPDYDVCLDAVEQFWQPNMRPGDHVLDTPTRTPKPRTYVGPRGASIRSLCEERFLGDFSVPPHSIISYLQGKADRSRVWRGPEFPFLLHFDVDRGGNYLGIMQECGGSRITGMIDGDYTLMSTRLDSVCPGHMSRLLERSVAGPEAEWYIAAKSIPVRGCMLTLVFADSRPPDQSWEGSLVLARHIPDFWCASENGDEFAAVEQCLSGPCGHSCRVSSRGPSYGVNWWLQRLSLVGGDTGTHVLPPYWGGHRLVQPFTQYGVCYGDWLPLAVVGVREKLVGGPYLEDCTPIAMEEVGFNQWIEDSMCMSYTVVPLSSKDVFSYLVRLAAFANTLCGGSHVLGITRCAQGYHPFHSVYYEGGGFLLPESVSWSDNPDASGHMLYCGDGTEYASSGRELSVKLILPLEWWGKWPQMCPVNVPPSVGTGEYGMLSLFEPRFVH